jgi:hypothetical protein
MDVEVFGLNQSSSPCQSITPSLQVLHNKACNNIVTVLLKRDNFGGKISFGVIA